jgi:FkbM family methyltransferase
VGPGPGGTVTLAPLLIRSIPGLALKRLVWSLVRRREFEYATTTPRGWRITGNTRDWIQRNLYYFGLWEPSLSAWIESRLSPGDVFVDVGANIGYFTLLAAQRVGSAGKVVAVEAMPAIYQHLATHVAGNSLANARLINEAAVGPGDPSDVLLYWGGEGNIGSSGMIRRSDHAQSVRVAARPLAQMLTEDECRRARLIKMDVEGVEARAIRGLGLERGCFDARLELIVEITVEPGSSEAQELMQYLAGLGFFPYVLPESHNFSYYAYPQRAVMQPRRLRQPLTHIQNVIFSKLDAETL